RVLAGKYEIVRLVGAGGMGAVYEARHRFTQRRVAIKMLHSHVAGSSEVAARFLQEAQAPSSIRHPGIVEVLDAGVESDGELYIALEFLEGEDLASMIDRGPLEPEVLARVAWQLLGALGAAHQRGFVHRDIKPQNIFLAREPGGAVRVKLLDFGIARLAGAGPATGLTQEGAILGTPMYMSPEQARAERVDGRSDLWSLGATLFHALAGRGPFVGENYNVLIVAVITTRAPSILTLLPDLHPALAEAIDRALDPDPANRWVDADAMANAIGHVAGARDPLVLAPLPIRERAADHTMSAETSFPSVSPATPAEALLETLASTPASHSSRRAMAPATPVVPATPAAWQSTADEASDEVDDRRSISPPTGRSRRWVRLVLPTAIATAVTVAALRIAWHRTRAPAAPPLPPVEITPTQLTPESLATLGVVRPTFRWRMPREIEAVSLEVCRDRACADVSERAYVNGTSYTLPADLAPGLWYWRLRGLSQGRSSERTSAVWPFAVRRGAAGRAASGARLGDFDGDGALEVVLAAPRAETEIGRVYVYNSGPGAGVPRVIHGVDGAHGLFGESLANAGDVNGDGFADLLVGASDTFVRAGRAYLYLGGRAGVGGEPSVQLRGIDAPESHFGAAVAGPGDVNGDGLPDLAVT
ncbi:MAG: protein kinase, partial [Deltaproteobacteria bacterium]